MYIKFSVKLSFQNLYILLPLVLLIFYCGYAEAAFDISTKKIDFGTINTSVSTYCEISDGITISLQNANPRFGDPEITVVGSLKNAENGRLIPASYMAIGAPIPYKLLENEPLRFSVGSSKKINLKINLSIPVFEPPGLYRGELTIRESNDEASTTVLPVTFKIERWVTAKAAGIPEMYFIADPGREIDNGDESYTFLVSGNCDWRLLARVDTEKEKLSNQERTTLENLRVKLLDNQWASSTTGGFLVLGPKYTLVASGKGSSKGTGAWIPITIKTRLPFLRNVKAGSYDTLVSLVFEPAENN